MRISRKRAQRGYMQAHRDRLKDAKIPERDAVASAVLALVLQASANEKPWADVLLKMARHRLVTMHGYSDAGVVRKITSMVSRTYPDCDTNAT